MALWGNSDSIYSTGTVDVNLETKQITGEVGVVTFTTSGISTNNVVTVGSGASVGYAVVTGFTSTTISIADTANFVSGFSTFAGESYFISGEPIYPLYDSNPLYQAPEVKEIGFSTSPVTTGVHGVSGGVFGVSVNEAGVARTTAYAVAHAGLVGMTTYIDTHGNLRVKSEVLVANGSIVSDAEDDALFPDS